MPVIPHSRPSIDASDRAAVEAALASGMLASGGGAERFERAVCAHLALPEDRAAATGSGSSALSVALAALGAGPGGEVIVPTYCCGSVARAVRATGATPVLCDVGPRWHATAETVEPRLTPRTKAVVLVHPFGIAADTASVAALGVPVVDDLCQAFPPEGRTPSGAAFVFSFHATKCLATGEGGMAASADRALAGTMRRLRGERAVAPLPDLAAALGGSQLARYPQMLRRRREIADAYFAALPPRATARLAEVRDRSVFFRFPVLREGNFEDLRAAFAERGVAVRRGVDALLHREAGLPDEAFPGAVDLFERTVSLPLYPALADGERETILDACKGLL